MRASFAAMILSIGVASSANAGSAPIFFDPRAPFERLMVQASIAGQETTLILDTGSPNHIWGEMLARTVHFAEGERRIFLDVNGRRRSSYAVDATGVLDGLCLKIDSLSVSAFGDLRDGKLPDDAHADGLLSPQRLVPPGHGLVLDLPAAQMIDLPWDGALERVRRRRLPLADVSLTPDGHFVVSAQVGERRLSLVIDTGAPKSLLFETRGDDVPAGAVRSTYTRVRLRVGGVQRDLALQRLERVENDDLRDLYDGLLGLDVLQHCSLAISPERLVARCDETPDLGAPIADVNASRPRVCLNDDGPCTAEQVEGGYRYVGDHIAARISADGHIQIDTLRNRALSMRSTREEREWLMESTRTLRHALGDQMAMRHSFEYLPWLLAHVWHEDRWSFTERRDILFRIWDECAEADDTERGAEGARARRMIDAFIRQSAPAGSKDAYAPGELTQLNARRVRGPAFDPYTIRPDDDLIARDTR